MSLKNCLIVLWVYIMYVLGMWLFLSGYLLKRIVIHQNSTAVLNIGANISCHNVSSFHSIYDHFIEGLDTFSCVAKNSKLKKFDKAVIIIIDALRYDFASYSDLNSLKEEHYLNKMPIFQNLIEKYSNNALLLPLTADPPTTTLQRLKGLTTGSLPTFIDISLNFASLQITEDNLIRQMKESNKTIVFMGDDTWDSIYPNQFSKSFSYPSFNVKDLDTVDNGILDHIYKEISNNSTDVVIAHFLGVDHCGHRYGPEHPEMSRKLMQMNNIIQKITEMLKNNTLLLVLGDHGMTDTGDHGGDSAKETSTALFVYSQSRIIFKNSMQNYQSAAQMDIVPTLSLLLGFPIPFSNLGSIIPDLFTFNSNQYCNDEEFNSLLGKALAAGENALQVHRYLKAYASASSEFDNSILMVLEEKLKNITSLWRNITGITSQDKIIFHSILKGYLQYILHIRNLCEKKWNMFNFELIILGSLVLCCTVLCNFWVSERVNLKYFLIVPASILFLFLHVVLYMFCKFHFWLPVAVIISYIFTKFLKIFYNEFVECLSSLLSIPTFILIFLFASSFSNSYVIYEDHIILYLLQSIILYRFYPFFINIFKQNVQTNKFKNSKRNLKVKYGSFFILMCLLFCIRMGSVFFKCREEQIPCKNSNFILSLEKLHSPQSYKILRLFISLLSVIVPVIIFLYISSYKVSNKYKTASGICIKYGIFFVCICTCLRWWLGIVSPEAVERILKGNEVVLTRSATFISIIMYISIILFPMLSEKPWTITSKEIYGESLGFFLFIIVQLIYLIAGDALSPSVSLMCTSVVLQVILSDLSKNAEEFVWLDVLTWNLLTRYWFYGTAHQATFTSIDWDAAFLLNHKEISSYILSGTLVVLNTFSSYVLMGLAFPAILAWSQPTWCSETSILRLHMKCLFCFGIKLLGCVIASTILRRHLMVWRVFSPRLLYEVLGILITMVSTCIGHFFIVNVMSKYHSSIRKNLSHMFSDKDQ